jgi:hypothetical protein
VHQGAPLAAGEDGGVDVVGVLLAAVISGVILFCARDQELYRGMVIGWTGTALPAMAVYSLTGDLIWAIPHVTTLPALLVGSLLAPPADESEDEDGTGTETRPGPPGSKHRRDPYALWTDGDDR